MVALAVAVTLAELCRQAVPSLPADPEESGEYTAVADEARANDDLVIAVTAYRKAVALDRANRHASDALRELCDNTSPTADDDALLAALEHVHRGDVTAAERALADLRTATGELPPGGHFVLGLVALERHDRTTAVRELELAGRDPAYAGLARDMLRLARRDGMIAAMVLVGSELDTNPQQLPDTPPMNASTGPRETDIGGLVTGAVTVRPHPWVALRNVLAWRKQSALDELDILGENAQAAFELPPGPTRASVQYDFDYDLVGGKPYLLAHRARAVVGRLIGATEIRVAASTRHRDFRQTEQDDFTGWVHMGEAGALFHLGTRTDLAADAIGWREKTIDPVFSAIAGGARIDLRIRAMSRLRIAATTTAWYSTFDRAEPDGSLRRDTHVEGGADIEVDLGDHAIALAGANAARNDSTVEDFRYWKLVARVAVAFTIGGP